MTSSELCISCRSPKTAHTCGICSERMCRSCSVFLEEGSFSFRAEVPEELKHTFYCQSCFDATVEPAREAYEQTLAQARDMYFFFGIAKHPLPILRKHKTGVKVEGCADRDETILRLAFQAVELGFNAIVEGEVQDHKVRKGAYQTTSWSGRGLPVEMDIERLERRSPRHR